MNSLHVYLHLMTLLHRLGSQAVNLALVLIFAPVLTSVRAEVPAWTAEGFRVPQPGTVFAFPRDHGSHPDFALEWWYVTGHLFTAGGDRFGFQATFFRRAVPRDPDTASPATETFGDGALYLAHMALLDVKGGRFLHQERLHREGWDAQAATNTLDVRNGNWSLRWKPGNGPAQGTLDLQGGVRSEAAFALQLEPQKPLVVFGAQGVSRKAAEPTAASHYLTFSRLAVTGTLELGGRKETVTGSAWMDHEFSSSQLGSGQVGWDWAWIQLQDGREVMAYRLRREDGSTDPFSTVAWVDGAGRARHVDPSQFTWKPVGTWTSPETGARYPVRVELTTLDPSTGRPVVFRLEPLREASELVGSLGGISYWEGACRVVDEQGREVGLAFMELTGYAASMAGRL